MKKEELVEWVRTMQKIGSYEYARNEYASKNEQKEMYLYIFESYLIDGKRPRYIIDELFERSNYSVLLEDSQFYRIINSVASQLKKLNMFYLIYMSEQGVVPIPGWERFNLDLKDLPALKLFKVLIFLEATYLGSITYIPSELFRPIIKTRVKKEIDKILEQLKNLSFTPSLFVFDEIYYKDRKIHFKFSDVASKTIIFYNAISRASM